MSARGLKVASVTIREVTLGCRCGSTLVVRIGAAAEEAACQTCGRRWRAQTHPVKLLEWDAAAGAELVFRRGCASEAPDPEHPHGSPADARGARRVLPGCAAGAPEANHSERA